MEDWEMNKINKYIPMLIITIFTISLCIDIYEKHNTKNEIIIYNNICIEETIKDKIQKCKPIEKVVEHKLKEDIEDFTLTFYTDLEEENSSAGPVNCHGERLSQGMVANNIIPQGTKIETKEFGELTVADRGGNNFNVRYRLDVFIARKDGESDTEYKHRVLNLGIMKIKGTIK
jgi:3D (Asp-Asp-Asp) domain-containing protein